jgi:hypothetical protein
MTHMHIDKPTPYWDVANKRLVVIAIHLNGNRTVGTDANQLTPKVIQLAERDRVSNK